MSKVKLTSSTVADGVLATVAIVVADDYEDSELQAPMQYLQKQGVECRLVGVAANKTLRGKKGDTVVTDKAAAHAKVGDFEGLLVPCGYSPDKLRLNRGVVNLVRAFFVEEKPAAAICQVHNC